MCWFCGLGRRRSPPPFPASSQPQQQNTFAAGNMALGPYDKVDDYLRGLAGAAEGFGHSSIGGLNGKVYHVTTMAG